VTLEEDMSFGHTNHGPRHEGWRRRHGRWKPSGSYMNRHGCNSNSPKDTPADFGAQGLGAHSFSIQYPRYLVSHISLKDSRLWCFMCSCQTPV